MASPQKEHGFTPIANELLRALVRAKLTGQQWDALMCIAMDSYGRSRKECFLSLKEIAGMMAVPKPRACEAIRTLGVRRIVPPPKGTPERTHHGNMRKINKNFDEWGGTLERTVTLERTGGSTLERTDLRTRVRNKKDKTSTTTSTPAEAGGKIAAALVAHFYDRLKAKLGERPASFNGGHAGGFFNRLLRDHPEAEIRRRIAHWFDSDDLFIQRAAWAFEIFTIKFNVLKEGPVHGFGKNRQQGGYVGADTPVGKYASLAGDGKVSHPGEHHAAGSNHGSHRPAHPLDNVPEHKS